jgi:hypothetical protein
VIYQTIPVMKWMAKIDRAGKALSASVFSRRIPPLHISRDAAICLLHHHVWARFLVMPSECKSFDGRSLTRIYSLEISFITGSAEEAWRNFIAFLCVYSSRRVD